MISVRVSLLAHALCFAPRCSGPSLIARTIRDIAHSLVIDDAAFEANVYENLHSLLPWTSRIPPLRAALAHVDTRHGGWAHDDTGRVDNAPCVPPSERTALTADQLDDLRRVAFVTMPPEMLHRPTLRKHTSALYERLPSRVPAAVADGAGGSVMGAGGMGGTGARLVPPTAVVTVGPPGSGKSYVAWAAGLSKLYADGVAPSPESYLHIDPDYWLTANCHNDNACRPLVNWLNHETFLKAVRLLPSYRHWPRGMPSTPQSGSAALCSPSFPLRHVAGPPQAAPCLRRHRKEPPQHVRPRHLAVARRWVPYPLMRRPRIIRHVRRQHCRPQDAHRTRRAAAHRARDV